MQRLGYGPVKRLAVTVTTRNVAAYRDPAVILIDQLKDIYIDGTLNPIDTTQWYQCAATGESSAGVSPVRGTTLFPSATETGSETGSFATGIGGSDPSPSAI